MIGPSWVDVVGFLLVAGIFFGLPVLLVGYGIYAAVVARMRAPRETMGEVPRDREDFDIDERKSA